MSEINATKRAGELALPVFVITPAGSSQLRDVHLGWVADWDDDDGLFLVTFTDELEPDAASDPESFSLLDNSAERRRREVAARPNQQRFKFDVLARYGAKCAVCDIDALEVLEAVHIAEKAKRGTDHPANGLVLCATHHRAFDRALFGVSPSDHAIHQKNVGQDLRITRTSLSHLRVLPHDDTIRWRWARWKP